ncbi:MAG: hypothetical protein PHW83_11220 [Bacteroidales bacterium]|nr:hypothetical protein [Bacteroidales bacterium]
MNTKKHLSLVLLGMIIVLPLLTTSCFKKGEDDPFFSIYTRKARVTGKWNITNMQSIIKTTYDDDVQIRTTTTINGLDWERYIEILNTESTRTYVGEVLEDRNFVYFDKEGVFKQTYEYQYIVLEEVEEEEEEEGGLQTQYRVFEEYRGTWNFLGNIDDYKNKERIAIVIEESKQIIQVYTMEISEDSEETPEWEFDSTYNTVTRYANGQYSTIWELDMLKNKEIHTRQNVNYYYTRTIQGQGGPLIEIGTVLQTLKPFEEAAAEAEE